ncbi:MAG: hypothetical protein KAI53_04235 [Candidatus Aenigmarchaeota archaeon]|nr:hypothetical protein [Candidatus Aenigmarchaeota archaeon]
MPDILQEKISSFSAPDFRNYRVFGGSLKADDMFWYGELPTDDLNNAVSNAYDHRILNSIYTGQIQCFFGFFKQPGEEGHMELDKILGIADLMYVTDLAVPPEKYITCYRGNNIPQEFKDMISRMGAQGTTEGEIRIVHASEITSERLSLDTKLYAIFRKS